MRFSLQRNYCDLGLVFILKVTSISCNQSSLSKWKISQIMFHVHFLQISNANVASIFFYMFHVNVKIAQTYSISPNTSNAVFKSFSSISSSKFPQYIDTLAKTKITLKLKINFLKASCFDKILSRFCLSFLVSVANKRFSVGWSMSWGSEGHFEAPVGRGKLHIFTSKKH